MARTRTRTARRRSEPKEGARAGARARPGRAGNYRGGQQEQGGGTVYLRKDGGGICGERGGWCGARTTCSSLCRRLSTSYNNQTRRRKRKGDDLPFGKGRGRFLGDGQGERQESERLGGRRNATKEGWRFLGPSWGFMKWEGGVCLRGENGRGGGCG